MKPGTPYNIAASAGAVTSAVVVLATRDRPTAGAVPFLILGSALLSAVGTVLNAREEARIERRLARRRR